MQRKFTINDALSIKRFRQRAPIHLSKDGNWLAYSVLSAKKRRSGGERFTLTGAPVFMEGSEVWVTEINSATSQNLTPDWGTSWSPRWSSDSEQLVFYSDKNGIPQLWLWEKQNQSFQLICDVAICAAYEFEIPKWTSDGKYVLTKLKSEHQPSLSREATDTNSQVESSVMRIWKHIPSETAPSTGREPAWFKDRAEDLGLIDVATGEFSRLMKEIYLNGFAVAPNNQAVAVIDLYERNLWVIPLDESQPRCLVEDVGSGYGLSFSWSPDSNFISYIHEGALCIVDVEMGSITNITQAHQVKFSHEYSPPLWHPDGKRCFCFRKRNLWEVSIETGNVRNLTENFALPVYNVLHENGKQTVWLQDETYLYLQTWDDNTKRPGWYRLDYQTGAIDKLIEEDSFHWGWYDSLFHTDVSTQAGRVVYTAEYSNAPPELFLSDLSFEKPRQVSRLNPEISEFSFGETRLIPWKSPAEKDLRATLLLPLNYQEGERYPLITYIYPGFPISDYVNLFGVSEVDADNLQILANHGYAVLAPDTLLKDGPPMPQLPDSVFSGIDYVIELGIADPQRLGIMGHSFGGSGVNWLITQTTRFGAAVSAAGTCNLISSYGTLTEKGYNFYNPDDSMGGSLWEQKNRYIENSPIFDLDRVETPLLLIVGSKHKHDVLQAEEMFSGLRRLNKKVVLANYLGQEHSPSGWSYTSRQDYWKRILAWFDEHLKIEDNEGRREICL